MSDCRHEWRHTFDGVECNLCRQVASVGWLIDELSDAEGLLADLRIQRDVAERELAEARVDLTNCADVGRRLEIELRRAVEWPVVLGASIQRACRRAEVAGLVERVSGSLASVRPDWPTDAFDALDRLARLAGGGA